MNNVTKVEFGKEDREHARRLARLIGIVEAHEADVLADPIKHMKMAAHQIALLRCQIEDAKDAERSSHRASVVSPDEPIRPSGLSDTIHVPKREWDALKAMREIVFSEKYKITL